MSARLHITTKKCELVPKSGKILSLPEFYPTFPKKIPFPKISLKLKKISTKFPIKFRPGGTNNQKPGDERPGYAMRTVKLSKDQRRWQKLPPPQTNALRTVSDVGMEEGDEDSRVCLSISPSHTHPPTHPSTTTPRRSPRKSHEAGSLELILNFISSQEKSTPWEGGIKTIGLVWSKYLKHGKKISNQLVHITDWLPTLYAAAG